MSDKYKTIDLFCGCGGMSLGFQNAGFDIVAAYDKWQPATEVYKLNFSHPVFTEDISDKSIQRQIKAYKPEVVIGGPPCQDFSTAGLRDETRGRAVLTLVYRDIVLDTHPKYFVMENVATITKSPLLNEIKQSFEDARYGLTQIVLDASLCSVPQSRKRFFLIGALGAEHDFLKEELIDNLSKKPMSMRDYFGDSLGIEHYFRIPTNYHRRGVFSIDEPCQTIRGIDRPIPPGYPGHPQDSAKIDSGVRPLTIKERSQVQTFPADFIFEGTKTNLNQMIGNAVPVKLAEYVARAILRFDEFFDNNTAKAQNTDTPKIPKSQK